MWSKAKVSLGHLCIMTCGHNTGYHVSRITLKIHMSVMGDESVDPIDFGLRDISSRSTLALCV